MLAVRLECYGYTVDPEDPGSAEELPLGQDFTYTSPVESMVYNEDAYSPPPPALENPKKSKRPTNSPRKKGRGKKAQETVPESSSGDDGGAESEDG